MQGPAKREVDTMDTFIFVCSSWYFALSDSHNAEKGLGPCANQCLDARGYVYWWARTRLHALAICVSFTR